MRQVRALLASALIGVSLTAHAGLFSDDEARQGVTDLRLENADLKAKLSAMSDRVAKLEELNRTQGVDLLQRMQSLQDDLAKLRGTTETQGYNLDNLQKQQKSLFGDLDNRVKALEKAKTAAPAAQPGAAQPGDSSSAGQSVAADPDAELKAFESGFTMVKEGKYKQAIASLSSFLAKYPTSPYAPNALYWTGGSQQALKDYKKAAATFQKFVKDYPENAKVPDALLNLATIHLDQRDRKGARKLLTQIVSKYSSSPAADLAKRQLAQLK